MPKFKHAINSVMLQDYEKFNTSGQWRGISRDLTLIQSGKACVWLEFVIKGALASNFDSCYGWLILIWNRSHFDVMNILF